MGLFRNILLSALLFANSFGYSQQQRFVAVGNNVIAVGNNLISIPTPSWVNINSMLHDGADEWWETTNITELNGINKLTISVWIRPGVVNISQEVCAKWDFSTQGQFAVELLSDEIRIYVANAINSNGAQRETTDAANLVADTWYYLAVVYDGTLGNTDRIKIYVDAVLEASTTNTTIPTSMTSASSTFKIARFGGSLTRYFNGHIDELYLFPGLDFTSGQVTEAYNSGQPADMSLHSAYSSAIEGWRFGDNPLTNFNSDVVNEWRMYGQKSNYNADSNNMEVGDRTTEVPPN